MLARVDVQHEVGKRALETCALVPVDSEACAGEFCGALEIEDAECFPQFPMRARWEVEVRFPTLLLLFDVVVFGWARRYGILRQIGKGGEDAAILLVCSRS